ncbi:phosphate/phosphite/phosphonate ABC transporter substrate-binding protein [Luteibacter jiangsuensis]|uniref:Phosphate/phosphite/phosphonate ABC transporter substrate-binding protein n=1 Tax=Luteibacter jiangsuensis TaxID=637577 RepID=A0ABX0Q797_9GAMM|nr:phosphate/phosphite/phosphonate ABC transporter substrate-binding protein [Luteibacter jiangsuensis]NID05522.1 phosphate/phosphite/phosphonate ABC transporter substrate-binding protein [Luteibacter jiangsuensis]
MRAWLASWLVCVLAAAPVAATSQGDIDPAAPLTFGILPIGGPAESLEAWRPMLDDLHKAIGRPVRAVSVTTYEGIAQAISEQRVDIAFLSGRLALDAVTQQNMQVIGRLTRGDGSRGYRAVLVVATDSRLRSLDQLFARAGKWRYARGEALSVSGYLVPETQLFAARGVDSDTFFASVHVDNHQNNALAVSNGEVDVATNNTADLERFQQHFPEQYARLRILWTSSLIPHAVIVIRNDLPQALRAQVAAFVTGYGKGKDGAREEANLKRIHDISGFAPADNADLIPFADIEYALEQRRATSAQWVSEAARDARFRKIRGDHDNLIALLRGK